LLYLFQLYCIENNNTKYGTLLKIFLNKKIFHFFLKKIKKKKKKKKKKKTGISPHTLVCSHLGSIHLSRQKRMEVKPEKENPIPQLNTPNYVVAQIAVIVRVVRRVLRPVEHT
jgi:hypothetical protein